MTREDDAKLAAMRKRLDDTSLALPPARRGLGMRKPSRIAGAETTPTLAEPLTLPRLADRIRKVANAVRAIGHNRHDNAEHFMLRVDEVAADLDKIASMFDGADPHG